MPDEPHLWARPLSPEFSADFFRLHDRADCGGCFCMYWHFPGDNDAWDRRDAAALRAEKERRIASEGDTGMILYENQEPVGWMGFGKRSSYPKLAAKHILPAGPDDLWSIVCFQVLPDKRRQGYARVLLAVGLEHLQRMGVKEVEAYPRAGQLPDEDAWTGPLKVYLDAGFRVVAGDPERPVVRKSL